MAGSDGIGVALRTAKSLVVISTSTRLTEKEVLIFIRLLHDVLIVTKMILVIIIN